MSIKDKLKGTIFDDAERDKRELDNSKRITLILTILLGLLSIYIGGDVICTFKSLSEGYEKNIGNIIGCFFTGGFILSLIIFCVGEVMVIKLSKMLKNNYFHNDEKNYDISKEHTYGAAAEMSDEEIIKNFETGKEQNMNKTIYGRLPGNRKIIVGQRHPVRKINRNTFVVAGPSAGKSACYVIPCILQLIARGESAIISDPKSELFQITSEFAKKLGYEVRILNLNPMFLEHSDPCNFMAYIKGDIDKAQVVANAMISTSTNGKEIGDFWTEGALNLLQAIILRINVGKDYRPEEKNIPQVFTYITEKSATDMAADFANLPKGHPAIAPFKIFDEGDDKVKAQVLQGLRIKLKLFNSPKLRHILSEPVGGIDVCNPGRKKCLYYVGKNDQDSSLDSIIALFFTILFQELVRYADSRVDKELPVAVHMILDEYANIGTIPDFEKKLSTVRSRNIVTHIICQDINQLKTKHPMDTWNTVLNDCDYYLMLKTNDGPTMKWWSEMSGKQTVTVKNKAYQKDKTDILGLHVDERISEGQGTRDALTTHEVRTLADDDILVLMSQRNIARLKTFFWKDHRYGKIISANEESLYILPVQHYPFWKLIADGVVTEDFDYDHCPSLRYALTEDDEIVENDNYDPDAMLGIKKNIIGEPVIKKNKLNKIMEGVEDKKKQLDEKQKQIKEKITLKKKQPEKKEENDIPVFKLNPALVIEQDEDGKPIITERTRKYVAKHTKTEKKETDSEKRQYEKDEKQRERKNEKQVENHNEKNHSNGQVSSGTARKRSTDTGESRRPKEEYENIENRRKNNKQNNSSNNSHTSAHVYTENENKKSDNKNENKPKEQKSNPVANQDDLSFEDLEEFVDMETGEIISGDISGSSINEEMEYQDENFVTDIEFEDNFEEDVIPDSLEEFVSTDMIDIIDDAPDLMDFSET